MIPSRPESSAQAGTAPALIALMRPKQWTKNLLVFAAIIFSGRFTQPSAMLMALAAFASMALVSSATYAINDIADAERDRLHPKKRHRPIAAGTVSPTHARILALVLLASGLGLALYLGPTAAGIVVGYLGLQVLYNGWLKRQPVADVYCIATGFVLRAVLGAAAIQVGISGWLLFCTGALALMLGFGKRRNEFVLQGEMRTASRESLVSYNRQSLDAMVIMFATASALCYGLYSLESLTAQRFPAIILTAPFVFYGITRYVLLIFTVDEGGEPADVLFRDPHLLVSISGFLLSAVFAMSGQALPILER